MDSQLALGGLALLLASCLVTAQNRFQVGLSSRDLIRSGVVVPAGATCFNEVPAYFVMDNMDVIASTSVVHKQLTEEQCSDMCTDNSDAESKPLVCAAFTYDHISFDCVIHRSKGGPDGILPLVDAPGRRYFEKFCLPPASAPVTCGEAHFFREHQYVLVGFAQNVTAANTLEECVRSCIGEGATCKSAMFFYEEGECITNSESAKEFPEVFAKEERDKVVYFENGCYYHEENEIKAAIKKLNEEKRSRGRTIPAPIQSGKPKAPEQPKKVSEVSESLGYENWNEWSACDRPDGRRVRRRKCLLATCSKSLTEVQWCDEIDPQELIPKSERTTTIATTERVTTLPPSTPVPFIQQGWGPWAGGCSVFGNNGACENGRIIGFERRACQGNPFQCQGPFFRYCTIAC